MSERGESLTASTFPETLQVSRFYSQAISIQPSVVQTAGGEVFCRASTVCHSMKQNTQQACSTPRAFRKLC